MRMRVRWRSYYVMVLWRHIRANGIFFDNFSVSRNTHAHRSSSVVTNGNGTKAQPNRREFTNHAISCFVPGLISSRVGDNFISLVGGKRSDNGGSEISLPSFEKKSYFSSKSVDNRYFI